MPGQPGLRTREVRERAVCDPDDGPITPSNRADLSAVARLLNVLLSSVIVSSLQYEHHAVLVRGLSAQPVAAYLLTCADDDRAEARALAARIRDLGFAPDHDPRHLAGRSRISFQSFAAGDLTGIVAQNLVAARILVQTLQEAVRWVGDADPTTRRLLERLLEAKEAQARVLAAESAPGRPAEQITGDQEVTREHP